MGVSIRDKNNDGLWWVFVRHAGQRRSEQVGTEADAIDVQKEIEKCIRLGNYDIAAAKAARAPAMVKEEKPELPTLRDYYEKTIQPQWDSTLSRNTFKSYDGSFRVHILPLLGSLTLPEITRERAKRFVAELRKKNIVKAPKKEKAPEEVKPSIGEETPAGAEPRLLSKETIRNIIAALRAGLSEAVDNKVIEVNQAVRLGKLYQEAADFHEEIDPFSSNEVSELLQATCTHYGFENYVLLLTLFHCGLRAGEAAGLYWSDLDSRNKALIVRRQFTRGRKGKPKTRKRRQVDLSLTLLAELQALKKQRQAEYLAEGKNEIPELIFLSPGQIVWNEGQPAGRTERGHVDMDNFRNRIFSKACDKAKIRRRRLHDTRHTFASLLLSNGEPLKYVSAQLGHASIRLTADVYGHLEPGSNRAAMDRLPSLETVATETQAITA